jgi:predicted GIY-YIG superfamily endonuclease
MKTQFYIYKLTCTVNGKSYVGQTSNPKNRFYRTHYRHNPKLLADIDRYGIVAFTSAILARTSDKAFAKAMETHFVDEYDTIANGYNTRRSFSVNVGLKRTAAANEKRRQAISGLVWMFNPTDLETKRVKPAVAKQLAEAGWKPGRFSTKSRSAKKQLFAVEIPEGTGDYFRQAN